MRSNEILLVYDMQCPACDSYCRRLRLHQYAGELKLVDARQPGDIMQEITDLGLDVDEGMVLKIGEQLYYGAEAMHILALLSSRSNIFNHLNFYLFKSRGLSNLLYPLLRSGRNLLLKLLRRGKINNLHLPIKTTSGRGS